MNPFENPGDAAIPTQPNEDAETKPDSVEVPEQKAKRKRKPPKSDSEQLAELEAKAESLRGRLDEQRVKLRNHLVDDLYELLDIGPITGDLNESQRINQLRKRLKL
ncbi:hypothetical protein [Nesterenkonia sp. CF4.4]|uniref:hypothetical protein n=1 Tax=Nesterenkonia sp. CF4.4 TaxID=3373079 RepID=UPI003EE71AD9